MKLRTMLRALCSKSDKELLLGIAQMLKDSMEHERIHLESVTQKLPTPSQDYQGTSLDGSLNAIYKYISQHQREFKYQFTTLSILFKYLDKNRNSTEIEVLDAGEVIDEAINNFPFENFSIKNKVKLYKDASYFLKWNKDILIFAVQSIIKISITDLKDKLGSILNFRIDKNKISIITEKYKFLKNSEFFILEALVNKFKGEIKYETTKNENSKITLKFPMLSEKEIKLFTEKSSENLFEIFANESVLVVDDRLYAREQIRTQLSHLPVSMDFVSNGALAIKKLQEKNYKVIIMDMDMPVLNGYKTAFLIRQDISAQYYNIPIVGYTAEPAAIAEIKMQRVGINTFLSKPAQTTELVLAIQKAIKSDISKINYGINEEEKKSYISEYKNQCQKIAVEFIESDLQTRLLDLFVFDRRSNNDFEEFKEISKHLILETEQSLYKIRINLNAKKNLEVLKSELLDLYTLTSALGARALNYYIRDNTHYVVFKLCEWPNTDWLDKADNLFIQTCEAIEDGFLKNFDKPMS